jgi:uncharacterized protein with HEPN domain
MQNPFMAELPDLDASLLLDMLLAARDARGFIGGLDQAAFIASRLHQNAVIRSLEVAGRPRARYPPPHHGRSPTCPGAGSPGCAIV